MHLPSQYMPPNPQDRSPTRTPPREQCEYSLAGQAVHCPSQYTSLGGQIEPESESASAWTTERMHAITDPVGND